MSCFLVTGGAGFIGSNIVAELVARGEKVRVLDNFSTGRRANLDLVAKKIEIVEGDIRSYHLTREAMEGVDFVLHQAALPSVPRSIRDPLTTTEVNVLGTINLLQAAQEAKVERFVFASSSSVYGNVIQLPQAEDMPPSPMSPYAVSKLAGENYCGVFWQIHKFETVCLRYFNVFGPKQDPASQYSAVIPKFATAILEDRPIQIFGDGSQSRDFTFVGNVVHANLLACMADQAPGRVVNIACGDRYSLLDLTAELGKLSNNTPQIEFLPRRSGDVLHSRASITLANEVLGYQPIQTFGAGLQTTFEWYKNHPHISEN